MYTEKFMGLLKTTAKGFAIGLASSIALTALFGVSNPGEFVSAVFAFTIIIGSIGSNIISSKSGAKGFMSSAAEKLWKGVSGFFFGSIFDGNVFLIAYGIMKALVGLAIMIPVGTYMALSYFFNFIYLGIMCALEKKNKLSGKEEVCKNIEKLTPVLTTVMTVVNCIMIFNVII